MRFILATSFYLFCISISTSSCFEWSNCGGSVLKFHNYTLTPNPIVYPGNVLINGDIEFLRDDLPNESLRIKVVIKKQIGKELFSVPCIKGMGSCTYNLCHEENPSFKDLFVKMFKVTCPLEKRHYIAKNVLFPLPKFGNKIIESMMEGHFEGRILFFNEANQEKYGCMDFKMDFQVKG